MSLYKYFARTDSVLPTVRPDRSLSIVVQESTIAAANEAA